MTNGVTIEPSSSSFSDQTTHTENAMTKSWADMMDEDDSLIIFKEEEEEKYIKTESDKYFKKKETTLNTDNIWSYHDKTYQTPIHYTNKPQSKTSSSTKYNENKHTNFLDKFDDKTREDAYQIQTQYNDYPGVAKTILANIDLLKDYHLRHPTALISLEQKTHELKTCGDILEFVYVGHWKTRDNNQKMFLVYRKNRSKRGGNKNKNNKQQEKDGFFVYKPKVKKYNHQKENNKPSNSKNKNNQTNNFNILSNVEIFD